jgi:phage terminase large subunit
VNKVQLHDGQYEVAKDTHRFRVICAGRRWGKSVLSRLIVYDWATKEPGLYWIVSPTYKQARMIHWREILKEIPKDWIERTINSQGSEAIYLKNGSIIELKGAENPDNLRGVKLRGIVVDEIASIKNWEWLWSEVLRPTLTDYSAPAIFISTPKGFNHFYELYQRGEDGMGDYMSWRFTTYDNPMISEREIETAKAELTEETFAQEYMADFRQYTGLVYKEFNPEIHVVKPFDIPSDWDVYGGMDFGSTNPTVHLWIAVDKDKNKWIFDEHYVSGRTIDYHTGIIRSNQYFGRLSNSYADPSGKQWIDEFATRGLYVTPAIKETGTAQDKWVLYGIEKVREQLKALPGHYVGQLGKDHQPKMFVFNTCKNTINEFQNYSWKEKKQDHLNEPDQVEKSMDHSMDALRYFVVSYKTAPKVEVPQQWEDRQWRIGK